MTLPFGVTMPPAAPDAAQMPAPTVLPPTMPSVTAPPHVMSAPAGTPMPAPSPAQPAGAPIFNDPSLPPELQGKTMPEVLQYYNRLRQHYLDTQPTAQGAPAVQQAPVTPAPQPVAPAPMPSAADFWADPVAAMDRIVQARLAPVTSNALQQQVVAARQTVVNAPGYAELESKVLETLNGINPEALTNPAIWTQAYHLAYGQAAASGWRPGATPAPTPAPAPTPTIAAPPTMNTAPRTFAPTQFFSEPARPNAGPTAALTPEQQAMATRLGMSDENYAKWMPKAGGTQ